MERPLSACRRPFPWLLAAAVSASITCGGGDGLQAPGDPVPTLVTVLVGGVRQGVVG